MKHDKYVIPVNLLEPFVYTCPMKFMMTRQYPHAVSFLIFHEAYIASVVRRRMKNKISFFNLKTKPREKEV